MKESQLRHLLRAVAAGAAIALSACGGGGGGSSEPPAPVGPPAPPPANVAGTLDPSFGVGGIVATPDRSPPPDAAINAIALQPDGKIVAAGYGGWGAGRVDPTVPAPALLRYNADGTLDAGFGNAGTYAGPADAHLAVALQPDGKIVAVGTYRFGEAKALIRSNANGTMDTAFGTEGTGIIPLYPDAPPTGYEPIRRYSSIQSVAVQPDGKIILGGKRTLWNVALNRSQASGFLLVRLNADGSRDPTFGSPEGEVFTPIFNGAEVSAIVVTPGGAIVAAGVAESGSIDAGNYCHCHFTVARYGANGEPDASYGIGGVATAAFASTVGVYGAAVHSDGRVVVAGSVGNRPEDNYQGDHFALTRFRATGALDTSFGAAGLVLRPLTVPYARDKAGAVAIQADGKIVAAGGDNGRMLVARYDAAGKPDPRFGNDGETLVSSLDGANAAAVRPDGRIVAAGSARSPTVTWKGQFALARFVGDAAP